MAHHFNEKISFYNIFFFQFNSINSEENIVYLDVQFIIDNSDIGIFFQNKVSAIQDDYKNKLNIKKTKLKVSETDIKNKKNILKKEEIDVKINELNKLIKDYQISRNEYNNNIIEEKKKYSKEILKILNPILTNFVEKNKIKLVLKKKDVLVGAKFLDITDQILNLLNEETKIKKLINEN